MLKRYQEKKPQTGPCKNRFLRRLYLSRFATVLCLTSCCAKSQHPAFTSTNESGFCDFAQNDDGFAQNDDDFAQNDDDFMQNDNDFADLQKTCG